MIEFKNETLLANDGRYSKIDNLMKNKYFDKEKRLHQLMAFLNQQKK